MTTLAYKGEWRKVGEYKGFDLEANKMDTGYQISLISPATKRRYASSSIKADEMDNASLLTRADNVIKNIPAQVDKLAESLDENEKAYDLYEKQRGAPFLQRQELSALENEYRTLENEITGIPASGVATADELEPRRAEEDFWVGQNYKDTIANSSQDDIAKARTDVMGEITAEFTGGAGLTLPSEAEMERRVAEKIELTNYQEQSGVSDDVVVPTASEVAEKMAEATPVVASAPRDVEEGFEGEDDNDQYDDVEEGFDGEDANDQYDDGDPVVINAAPAAYPPQDRFDRPIPETREERLARFRDDRVGERNVRFPDYITTLDALQADVAAAESAGDVAGINDARQTLNNEVERILGVEREVTGVLTPEQVTLLRHKYPIAEPASASAPAPSVVQEKGWDDRVIMESVAQLPDKLAGNQALQNAIAHSSEENQRVEFDIQLKLLIAAGVGTDTALYKLYTEDAAFKEYLDNKLFNEMKAKASGPKVIISMGGASDTMPDDALGYPMAGEPVGGASDSLVIAVGSADSPPGPGSEEKGIPIPQPVAEPARPPLEVSAPVYIFDMVGKEESGGPERSPAAYPPQDEAEATPTPTKNQALTDDDAQVLRDFAALLSPDEPVAPVAPVTRPLVTAPYRDVEEYGEEALADSLERTNIASEKILQLSEEEQLTLHRVQEYLGDMLDDYDLAVVAERLGADATIESIEWAVNRIHRQDALNKGQVDMFGATADTPNTLIAPAPKQAPAKRDIVNVGMVADVTTTPEPDAPRESSDGEPSDTLVISVSDPATESAPALPEVAPATDTAFDRQMGTFIRQRRRDLAQEGYANDVIEDNIAAMSSQIRNQPDKIEELGASYPYPTEFPEMPQVGMRLQANLAHEVGRMKSAAVGEGDTSLDEVFSEVKNDEKYEKNFVAFTYLGRVRRHLQRTPATQELEPTRSPLVTPPADSSFSRVPAPTSDDELDQLLRTANNRLEQAKGSKRADRAERLDYWRDYQGKVYALIDQKTAGGPPETIDLIDRDDSLPDYDLNHDAEYRRLMHRHGDLYNLERMSLLGMTNDRIPEEARAKWESHFLEVRRMRNEARDELQRRENALVGDYPTEEEIEGEIARVGDYPTEEEIEGEIARVGDYPTEEEIEGEIARIHRQDALNKGQEDVVGATADMPETVVPETVERSVAEYEAEREQVTQPEISASVVDPDTAAALDVPAGAALTPTVKAADLHHKLELCETFGKLNKAGLRREVDSTEQALVSVADNAGLDLNKLPAGTTSVSLGENGELIAHRDKYGEFDVGKVGKVSSEPADTPVETSDAQETPSQEPQDAQEPKVRQEQGTRREPPAAKWNALTQAEKAMVVAAINQQLRRLIVAKAILNHADNSNVRVSVASMAFCAILGDELARMMADLTPTAQPARNSDRRVVGRLPRRVHTASGMNVVKPAPVSQSGRTVVPSNKRGQGGEPVGAMGGPGMPDAVGEADGTMMVDAGPRHQMTPTVKMPPNMMPQPKKRSKKGSGGGKEDDGKAVSLVITGTAHVGA